MNHDVFISYSVSDKTIADATCASLEGQGFRCWIAPRDVPPGSEWAETIVAAITKAKVFVIIFSEKSNESPQVRREVERAVSRGLLIVPIRVQDIEPSGSMEYFLSGSHWLDAISPPMEDHLHKLGNAIRVFLKLPAEEATEQTAPGSESTSILKGKRSNTVLFLAAGIAIVASATLIPLFVTGRGDAATPAGSSGESSPSTANTAAAAQDPVPAKTPKEIIERYCEAWKQGDSEAMYATLASTQQAAITLEAFAAVVREDSRGVPNTFKILGRTDSATPDVAREKKPLGSAPATPKVESAQRRDPFAVTPGAVQDKSGHRAADGQQTWWRIEIEFSTPIVHTKVLTAGVERASEGYKIGPGALAGSAAMFKKRDVFQKATEPE